MDQEPVQRAVVEIAYTSDLSQRRQTVTGEDGRFAFPDLAAGKYSLAAAARGFRLQAFNQHEQFSSAVAVGEGQSSKNLTFRIEPDGGIHCFPLRGKRSLQVYRLDRPFALALEHNELRHGGH